MAGVQYKLSARQGDEAGFHFGLGFGFGGVGLFSDWGLRGKDSGFRTRTEQFCPIFIQF